MKPQRVLTRYGEIRGRACHEIIAGPHSFRTCGRQIYATFSPTKSVSSLRVVSRAAKKNSGASRKNETARSGRPAAMECDVAIQPTIAGAVEPAAAPKANAAPTAVPRIWVGNSSVV